MGMLGEISLRFGESGDEGEPSLQFVAGHINLIVGPNNAGKSLFLREVSGKEPRAQEYGSSRRNQQTKIVANVDWSTDQRDDLRAFVLAAALEDSPQSIIGERQWSSLVAALRRVPVDLAVLRREFAAAVRPLVVEVTKGFIEEWSDLIALFWGELGEETAEPWTVMAGVAVLAYLNHETAERDEADEGEPEGTGLSASLSSVVHGPLLEAAHTYWTASCELFGALGISTDGLSVDEVLDGPALLRFLMDLARQTPILSVLLLKSDLPDLEPLEPDAFVRFQIVEVLGRWMLDPSPLEELADDLESTYRAKSWNDPDFWAECAGRVLYLDGLERLSMTRATRLQPFGTPDHDAPPILALLKDPHEMEALRALVADALGAHLVIDMNTATPNVLWRLASHRPAPGVETTYGEDAHTYVSAATPLIEKSDGIHAFVGMLASIIARGSELIFIDEPEAFLHPPLVRKLARQIAALARKSDAQFFIATHSSEMLASAAMSGVSVNVLRLTYQDGVATARLLDSDTLREIALDPLMRSESVLSALFHDGAVVCEAAADRVLYQEVNERLITCDPDGPGGIESCVFVNAQNWQTVPNIVGPLRRAGVAAVAIIDADALFGSELSEVLAAAQMSRERQRAVRETRDKLRKSVEKRAADDATFTFKGQTIAGLSRKEKKVFEVLLEDCAAYGVFFVPVGELEDWLRPIGLKPTKQKTKWFRRALDRLGRDPDSDQYVRPGPDDIWAFMRRVASWINDPRRRGTGPADMEG